MIVIDQFHKIPKLTSMKAFALLISLISMTAQAQTPTQGQIIRLWDGAAPLALGDNPHDVPKITCYPANQETSTGHAIIVCPGGGYGALAQHEGADYALWLNQQGIHAFVLQYRLGKHQYRHPSMLNDAARAVRLVRHHATTWGVKKVGIMGSSAGGHLASTLLTHFDSGQASAPDAIDRQPSKPDFGILCYPVINLSDDAVTHKGSRNYLLGEKPTAEMLKFLSNETQVTPATPPTFLWHTADDAGVPVANSLLFASSLARHKVPHELHIYRSGRHGIGLATKDYLDPTKVHPWATECRRWLQEIGIGKADKLQPK